MAIRSKDNMLGAWAFLVGVVLALMMGMLGALFNDLNSFFLFILLILGLIMGFIGVSPNDIDKFMVSSVSLVIVSFAGTAGVRNIEFLNWEIGNIISSTMGSLLVLLVPATIVVAVRSLFSISQR